MRNVCAAFFLLFATNSLPVFSQSNNLNALDSFSGVLLKNLRAAESEKAYLTTDKDVYSAGEAIWFRSFLLRSASEKISTKSRNLFVDLVNEKDSVVAKVLLRATDQQTGGKMTIPAFLPTGFYWARAYTQTILLNDPNDAAVVPVYILNATYPNAYNTPQRLTSKSTEQPIAVDMFPEGGTLMTGINTSIGFYCHDQTGYPVVLTGNIKDNRDSVVATFTTDALGLAKTEFSPFFHRKYKATVAYNGKEYSFPLPSFNRFAGQLSAQKIGVDKLKLRTILEDSIYRKDAVTYLVGLSRDSLCFASFGLGSYETDIDLTKIPPGIATFLLFDKNFRLLSERKVYVKNGSLSVSAQLDKITYSKRTKANLAIGVADGSGQPLPATLTIAVRDSSGSLNRPVSTANLFQKTKEGRLSNWDLLHLDALPEQDIDLLLMSSQAFTQTQNKKVSEGNEGSDDSLLYIKGRLTSANGEPQPNQTLNLISRTGNGLFLSATTNVSGRFLFPVSDYTDSTQFIIQAESSKSKFAMPRITLDPLSFPRFQTPVGLKQAPVLTSSQRMRLLRKIADSANANGGGEWLQQVRLETKAPKSAEKMRTASAVLTSEQLMQLGMGNIGIGLLRLPGAQIIDGVLVFYGANDMNGVSAKSEPIVLLDGNQLSLGGGASGPFSSPVIQFLNSLNPREIESIEVFKGPEASLFGIRGGNGVISIHSSSKIHQDFVTAEGNVFKFWGKGYARPALFLSADYTQKSGDNSTYADVRSTLYWAENELVDKDGKASFAFFTNDVPGNYQVVVSGVTSLGELIYKTLSFAVK